MLLVYRYFSHNYVLITRTWLIFQWCYKLF